MARNRDLYMRKHHSLAAALCGALADGLGLRAPRARRAVAARPLGAPLLAPRHRDADAAPRRGSARGCRHLQPRGRREEAHLAHRSRSGSSAYASTSPFCARNSATRRRASTTSIRACARSSAPKKRVSTSSAGIERQPRGPQREPREAGRREQQLAGHRDGRQDRGQLGEPPPLEAGAEQVARQEVHHREHRDVGPAQRDPRSGDPEAGGRLRARATRAARCSPPARCRPPAGCGPSRARAP